MIKYNEWVYDLNEDIENNGMNSFVTCQYHIKDTYDFMYYTIYTDYDYDMKKTLGVFIQNCYFQIDGEEIDYDRTEPFINSLGEVWLQVNQNEINMRDWMMAKYKKLKETINE